MLSMADKRKIGACVRRDYACCGVRRVRFLAGGVISILVERKPNNGCPGWIFAGWEEDYYHLIS